MIRKVVIRRFKSFREVTFDLPGHVVLAGPNNTGKTTLLQAIAAWDLGFRHWRETTDSRKHKGHYSKAPIARQAFLAVPLRSFDLLWHERVYDKAKPIEIEVQGNSGWNVTMEFLPDTTEQIHVRPTKLHNAEDITDRGVRTVFVPPMSGVALEEPLYANQATLDAMLARTRAGDVLRNLLFQASQDERAWREIRATISRVFGYELVTPAASGAFIQADFKARKDGPSFDLMGSGSGFQQVLMLLCFLHTRPGSVLLLDEPDAHLHVVLQDAIYGELKSVAAQKNSQLVIATHSEVIVNAADVDEIRVTFDPSRPLAEPKGKAKENLRRALRCVTNVEIAQAQTAPGILYVEDYTDLEILRAWARTLGHPAHKLLTVELFWRKTVSEPGPGFEGVRARDHYEALRLVRDLPGLLLVDGDSRPEIESTPITGTGLQRLRWRRYEIESYMVDAAVLARFVENQLGAEAAQASLLALREFLDQLPRGKLLEDYLRVTKARESILPPALEAAGLPGFPYTRYHEIAAIMKPEEIHPEVIEKLDGICKAFGR